MRRQPIGRPSETFQTDVISAEVKIDPDTGATNVVGYWVVDDVGTVINPVLVKGQIMAASPRGSVKC